MNENCLFCRIIKGEIPAEKIWEDVDLIAFKDIRPVAPVHILVVPKEHIATLGDLKGGDERLGGRMLLVTSEIARKQGIAESGYRTVINCGSDSGQIVFHLHVHLIGGRQLTAMG